MPLHADPGGDGARLTAALAGRHPDAAILAVGDLAYYDGSPANFGLCFDRFWGRLKPRVLPAPGNHEYNSRDAYGYFEEWGPRAGPERRGYYAVERGNWLLLSLNSEVAANPGSDQADWLDGVLVQSDATCILAFFHKPAYSLQARPDSQNARLLFERLSRAGAALVVNGHNHFYERSLPLAADGTRAAGGLVTFVVGTGGASPTSPIRPVESTATSIFGVYGLLRLELLDGSYRWQFIDAKTDAVLDSGESACTRPRLSARK